MSTITHNVVSVKGLSNYKLHRLQANKLADVYDYLYHNADTAFELDRWDNKRDRVRHCGTLLMGDIYERLSCVGGEYTIEQMYKLTGANFCRVMLCPMCQWRRASKLYGTMVRVWQYIFDDYKTMEFDASHNRKLPRLRALLLTLTVPNVSGEYLRTTIQDMADAWHNLTKWAVWRKSVKGYYRCLEVTYNALTDTYHPHYHVMLLVTEDYFARDNASYISRDMWLQMWRDCMDDDSICQVDIRPLKGNTPSAVLKSLNEVCKYTCKPSDYLDGDMQRKSRVVSVIDQALDKVRRASWGGWLKAAKQVLALDEELLNTDYLPSDDWVKVVPNVWYHWSNGVGDYVEI
jgi:plasmid rolling circle replication initiator protein Rep